MKSKFFTRALLVILAIAMLASLVACGGEKDPAETSSATGGSDTGTTSGKGNDPETDPWVIDGVKLDVGEGHNYSAEFNIYSRNSADLYNNLYLSADDINQTSTKVDIAVADRAAYIEENYGIYINITGKVDYEQMNSQLAAACTAGDVDKHMINNHGRKMLAAVLSGYFTSYDKLDYVNLKAPWWNQDANDSFTTPSGKVYATTGDLDYMSVGEAVGMYFNKTIINDIDGLELPYTLVEKDEWTLEKFEEYVKAADSALGGNAEDTDIATGYFGYSSGPARGAVSILYSAGSRGITKNASGELEITMKNNTVINAFDDYFTLLCKNPTVCYCFYDTNYTPTFTAFKEGRLAFCDNIVDVARTTFRTADVDYGILPWPKYDDTVDGYYCFPNANGHLYGVLKTFGPDDLEMISVCMELMAFLGSRDIINEYYDSVLSYQYFHAEEDVEMLKIIRKGIVFDLDYYFGAGVVDTGMDLCKNNYTTKFTAIYEGKTAKTLDNIAKWTELGF